MTLSEISIKMFRTNFHRYRLYFFCNVFSIVLFYCFAALFTNRTFMNYRVVDSMISSNIIAPSVFVAVFMALFIPYTYGVFMRTRKHEYGILMALGMSAPQVLADILLENGAMALLSLSVGLLLGTLTSFLFFFFIHYAIGVSGVYWVFNIDSYLYTAALYAVIMLITVIAGALLFAKSKLTDLMLEKFRPEKKTRPLTGLFPAGVALLAVSVWMMLHFNHSKLWFAGLGLMGLGLYLVMTHRQCLDKYREKIRPGYGQKHILGLSFIRQHGRSAIKIRFIATWMFAFSVLFGGLALTLHQNQLTYALRYSPFDLVYSRIFGKNQVSDGKIESLLRQNGVTVQSVKHLDYLRSNAFNILPVSQVNKNFGCHYQVSKGRYLTVFQFDPKDGYDHVVSSPETLGLDCGPTELNLQPAGSDIKILFNDNPTFADSTYVVNDKDFSFIASRCQNFWEGTAELYTFTDWKNSKNGIDAVQKFLTQVNGVGPKEQEYYEASSKLNTFVTAKQSSDFLIFLMFFIVVLFFMAAQALIHFKIKAESEEERRMVAGLNRIGATTAEMAEMIRYKNAVYYLPQALVGLGVGVFYNTSINAFYGNAGKAAIFSLSVGILLAALQTIYTKWVSHREVLQFLS